MHSMFADCKQLKTIYVKEFDISAVTDARYMFGNAISLVGGKGTIFDESKTNKEYARIDMGSDSPGYFTLK